MRRGEIWLVRLDPTVGAEMQKTRPALVVNDDAIGVLPLSVVVPITRWQERYSGVPWLVRIEPSPANGLRASSVADTFQLRSAAHERFIRRLGAVSGPLMRQIEEALARLLSIPR